MLPNIENDTEATANQLQLTEAIFSPSKENDSYEQYLKLNRSFPLNRAQEQFVRRKEANEKRLEGGKDFFKDAFFKMYFVLNGINCLITYGIMIAEADFFDKNYPNFLFNFYFLLPQIIGIPFSLITLKWFSCFKLNTNLIIANVLMYLFYLVLPLFPALYPGSLFSKKKLQEGPITAQK